MHLDGLPVGSVSGGASEYVIRHERFDGGPMMDHERGTASLRGSGQRRCVSSTVQVMSDARSHVERCVSRRIGRSQATGLAGNARWDTGRAGTMIQAPDSRRTPALPGGQGGGGRSPLSGGRDDDRREDRHLHR